MISISSMTLEDFELIKENLSSDFDEFWNPSTLKSELLNKNSKCIVAKDSAGNVIGFASMWKAVDDIHITNIVVRNDFRNQGIRESATKRTYKN
ncbi:MAG: GNAT family N-acetyltransferase [Oscillospiraceae bacterium]|nr:GNAT family N-acetyltransferase [Oscillospiraceae bacterium]